MEAIWGAVRRIMGRPGSRGPGHIFAPTVLKETGDVPDDETSCEHIVAQEYRNRPHPEQRKHPHTYPDGTPRNISQADHGVSFNSILGLSSDNHKTNGIARINSEGLVGKSSPTTVAFNMISEAHSSAGAEPEEPEQPSTQRRPPLRRAPRGGHWGRRQGQEDQEEHRYHQPVPEGEEERDCATITASHQGAILCARDPPGHGGRSEEGEVD